MTDTAVETPAVEAETPAVEKPKREKKAPAVATPCKCSLFTGQDIKGNELSTDCQAETIRVFAPGHDAKLKSLLIKSAIAKVDVTRVENGVEQELSPVHAAEEFNFRALVEKGLAIHERKEGVRAERAAERKAKVEKRAAEKQAAKDERAKVQAERKALAAKLDEAEKAANENKTPGPATAKIGRNKFDGEVLADGTFRYKDAKGEDVEVENYKIVIDPASLAA